MCLRNHRRFSSIDQKYRQSNGIERMFSWLKEKRRIMTRFVMLTKSYSAMV